MSLDHWPEEVSVTGVAAALGLPEDEMLRQCLAEGWHRHLCPPGATWGFRVDCLPDEVLGKVLQWLSWGGGIPPRIHETDPWGDPCRYDRRELWSEFAALTPRQRERGLIRARAAATTEAYWHDNGGSYIEAAARTELIFREDDDVAYRIEGITAEQIEDWSLEEPGVRNYDPPDWPVFLAPREEEGVPGKPPMHWEAWALFAGLLLAPGDRLDTAAAYERVRARAEFEDWGSIPPLEAFEDYARIEIDSLLRDDARNAALEAIWESYKPPPPRDCASASKSEALWQRVLLCGSTRIPQGCDRAEAVGAFRYLVDVGGLPAPEAARRIGAAKDVPAGALLRWHAACDGYDREDWPAVLTPLHGGGPGKKAIRPEALEFLKRDYLDRRRKPAFTLSCDRARAAAGANGWGELPSNSTLRRRFRAEVPSEIELLIREGWA